MNPFEKDNDGGEKLGPGLLPVMDLQSAAAHAGWEQRGASSPQGQSSKAAVAAVTPGTRRASGGRGGGSRVGWLPAQGDGCLGVPSHAGLCMIPPQGRSPSRSPCCREDWIYREWESGDYAAGV